MRLLQVGDVAGLIRAALEDDQELQDVLVEAELGDCSRSGAGHWYFTLKDVRPGQGDRYCIQGVMFRGPAQGLRFQPATGQQVIAHGKVSTYAPRGSLQLYIDRLEPKGVGALALAFQQLVERLESEGLFAASRKRSLPYLPRRVAVVTSRQGAALRDVIHVAQRRCPITEIVVVPTLVQGEGSVESIVAALGLAGRAAVDVVLLVRGGGSMEDLQAFNSEAVARAVSACPRPVVTGVGHETDTTVVDFVADRRAPTPSAAAELTFPSLTELRAASAARNSQLQRRTFARLQMEGRELSGRTSRLERLAPAMRLASSRLDLDQRMRRMQVAVDRGLVLRRHRIAAASAMLGARGPSSWLPRLQEEFGGRVGRLEALSPLAVLSRGYSITRLETGGDAIVDSSQVAPGDILVTQLNRGSVRSQTMAPQGQKEGRQWTTQ